ncbi:hypothetical protein [Thiocystis minor]|uniref:hypothetical protein n=1 Tax=Thiocystis minor TaxID=61597 RepID=UPI0019148CBA|nr:hypothetical protein [Thiocystis minor]
MVTGRVDGATLAATLELLGSQTGIDFAIESANLAQSPIIRIFNEVPLDEAIQALAGSSNVFVYRQTEEGRKLEKVIVLGRGVDRKTSQERGFSVAYGPGDDQLGAVDGVEGASEGPASFAVDQHGNLLVCDTVNHRLQVYDPDGRHVRSMALGEIVPEDVVIDKDGLIYVYGTDDTLSQLDANGNVLTTIAVDHSRWDSRGPMRMVDGTISIRANGIGDTAIAGVASGSLTQPTEAQIGEGVAKGFRGADGQRFVPEVDWRNKVGNVRIDYPDGRSVTASLPKSGVIGAEFLGEDQGGNFYVKTEAEQDDSIAIDVLVFDPNGRHQSTIAIPDEEYHYWSMRSAVVTGSGEVFNMAPGSDHVRFHAISQPGASQDALPPRIVK